MEASLQLLQALLPEPQSLLGDLAPEGWAWSALHLVFHPTEEQRAEELLRLRRATRMFSGGGEVEAPVDHEPMESERTPGPARTMAEPLEAQTPRARSSISLA